MKAKGEDMAVRLKTERDMVETYSTSFGVDSYEPIYVQGNYKSKCGREWKGKPPINEECDHLDCAIWANEQYRRNAKTISLILIGSGLVFMLFGWTFGSEFYYWFGQGVMCLSIIYVLDYLYGQYKARYLKEFKDKGTIRGVKAHQIKEI